MQKTSIVVLIVALLVTVLVGTGCGHMTRPNLQDQCAGHTVMEPNTAIVTYPNFEGHWRPTDREIWSMETKLQKYFINPTMQLGNASYSGNPPP